MQIYLILLLCLQPWLICAQNLSNREIEQVIQLVKSQIQNIDDREQVNLVSDTLVCAECLTKYGNTPDCLCDPACVRSMRSGMYRSAKVGSGCYCNDKELHMEEVDDPEKCSTLCDLKEFNSEMQKGLKMMKVRERTLARSYQCN